MAISKSQMHVIIGILLLFVGITLGAVFSGANHSTETQNQSVSATPTSPATSESANVCYFDWTYYTTSQIGNYYVAPSGYSYAIVNLYLKNEADQSVSTNPNYWPLTVDGITYSVDVATFSDTINHQSVDVGKGGEIETQIAYLVKGNPSNAYLGYSGLGDVRMELTNVYYGTHF